MGRHGRRILNSARPNFQTRLSRKRRVERRNSVPRFPSVPARRIDWRFDAVPAPATLKISARHPRNARWPKSSCGVLRRRPITTQIIIASGHTPTWKTLIARHESICRRRRATGEPIVCTNNFPPYFYRLCLSSPSVFGPRGRGYRLRSSPAIFQLGISHVFHHFYSVEPRFHGDPRTSAEPSRSQRRGRPRETSIFYAIASFSRALSIIMEHAVFQRNTMGDR